jgi:hypothetical protein
VIPDSIYDLTPRDLAGPRIECFRVRANSVQNNIVITGSLSTPIGRLVVLQQALVIGESGGNAVDRLTLTVESADVIVDSLILAYLDKTGQGLARDSVTLMNAVILRGPLTIRASAIFQAAAPANSLALHLVGYTIPIGDTGLTGFGVTFT